VRREDEHAPVGAQHASRLAERRFQIVDLRDHVTAPHEVEVPVGVGELLQHADEHLDAILELRCFDRDLRPVDVHLDRVDPDPRRPVTPDELDQVSSVATAGVEDLRARVQIAAGNVVERGRPARVEGLIERVVDLPGLIAVDARQLFAIAWLVHRVSCIMYSSRCSGFSVVHRLVVSCKRRARLPQFTSWRDAVQSFTPPGGEA
jgi:hypothetical protein